MFGSAIATRLQSVTSAPATGVHGALSADSVRMDQSPLPGGVANIFRFLFSGVPQWVQIAGIVIGAIVGLTLVTLAWTRRARILDWLGRRSSSYKLALGVGVGTTLLAAGLAGGWTYHYMMQENDFCSSCHVMKSAFGRFQKSEHSKLQCHSCHQQSLIASSKELYYWVMERPDKIPEHSKVPDKICAECHITQKRDSVWQFISATAGHQVHLKSDSSALRDVMCVSCHAKEVHAFAPTDLSCTQSGCHDTVKIKLGKMADQTALHCTTCHEFARPVTETAPLDSGRQGLVPLKPQCFSCHEMREKLAASGLDKDPHKASCGACHNPHKEEKAAGAIKSCATSECHASADTLTAFHRGLGAHAIDDCTACHKSHSWKVESTDCLTCHKSIFEDRTPKRGLLRRVASPVRPLSTPRRLRGGPSADESASDASANWTQEAPTPEPLAPQAASPARQPSPFQHSRHRKLACAACHSSEKEHGTLVVRTTSACQQCHHGDKQREACATCHTSSEIAAPRAVTVNVRVSARAAPVDRALSFEHGQHAKQACATCHGDDANRAVIKSCTSCHIDHHAIQRTCTACHPTPRAGHARSTHDGCASCHTDVTVASLPPVRTLCLSCHPAQQSHYPAKECVACHRVSWNAGKGAVGAK